MFANCWCAEVWSCCIVRSWTTTSCYGSSCPLLSRRPVISLQPSTRRRRSGRNSPSCRTSRPSSTVTLSLCSLFGSHAYRFSTPRISKNSLSAFAKPSRFLLLNAMLRLTFSSQLTPPSSDPPSNAPWFFNRLRRYINSVLTYLLTYLCSDVKAYYCSVLALCLSWHFILHYIVVRWSQTFLPRRWPTSLGAQDGQDLISWR